jgi:hypothetical protein
MIGEDFWEDTLAVLNELVFQNSFRASGPSVAILAALIEAIIAITERSF